MYIKSIVIEGFKSYAQKTEIWGFDPQFNAITGLNGSGKSNILDAICFVLGISNLSQVRAGSLQELVYKNGQAGVNKAMVSITFDNTDPSNCPAGYQQFPEITVSRQVVIGGRNKYLVNGINANNIRVSDLFRTVSLNVNNPHFLIMQGRITKVLNMKPVEILAMVTEAAGTSYYESKKDKAEKIIEKKDAKLREIDTVLAEEIYPSLNKMKDDKQAYVDYQKIIRELERLSRFLVAHQYICAQEQKEAATEKLVSLKNRMQLLQGEDVELKTSIEDLIIKIDEVVKKRDEEAGGTLQELEDEVNEKKTVVSKTQSGIKIKKDILKTEQKKLTNLEKDIKSDSKALAAKENEYNKISKSAKDIENERNKLEMMVEEAQKHYQAVIAGIGSDGGDETLRQQLGNAKKALSTLITEHKIAVNQIKHNKSEVKRREEDLKKTEQAYKKDSAGLEVLRRKVKALEDEIAKTGYAEGIEEDLLQKRQQLRQETIHLQNQIDHFLQNFPQLRFDYRDPEPNFDRRCVYGPIATLIDLKDPSFATALEVIAGGKLYNIVVDTEATGKLLLKRGNLQNRVTFIPLNKISSKAIEPVIVKRAENLVGKNHVNSALSVVSGRHEVAAALQYVFGSSLICSTMEAAKKVCYDESILKPTVTLDGDSFNPGGTLTGGSRNRSSSILSRLAELSLLRQKLQAKQSELNKVVKELEGVQRMAQRYQELRGELNKKQQELDLVEARVGQTSHHQQLTELKALKEEVSRQEELLETGNEQQAQLQKEVDTLEHRVKNSKQEQANMQKAAQKKADEARISLEEHKKSSSSLQNDADTLNFEIESLKKDLQTCEQSIQAVKESIQVHNESLESLSEEHTKASEILNQVQEQMNEAKERLKLRNKEVDSLQKAQSASQKHLNENALKQKELEHMIAKADTESKEMARLVSSLDENHAWIQEEKRHFGKSNSAYDFNANDPKEAKRRVGKLQEEKGNLAKNVNMEVMKQFSQAEQECKNLQEKRETVLKDKMKIAAFIENLEERKVELLGEVHNAVNKDFGNIFSTLLPGTKAKLDVVDGGSIMNGLEVKVAFGDVWKESLNELSGGQRSLVALSLILAMLMFKPAPLYILDEVDAALDLSHTQNIGQMLRTYFNKSQFIVVSLKDGMFNNANVLFKTKFVDGVSTVTRHTQAGIDQRRPPVVSNGYSKKDKRITKKQKK